MPPSLSPGSTVTRRLRAFKRWMRSQGIEWSDALELVVDGEGAGIYVRAVADLHEGDLVASIPKRACLTVKNSAATDMIEAAGLDGCLALAVALMYEQSLGSQSPWAAYLGLLPPQECLPLVWTLDQVDSLLSGTELHKIVKEDKAIVYEDWKECIFPLLASASVKLDPKFFGVEQYFAAKSLIASRSFQIDDYHGSGMVPLADLFNHKTGAEDVHFSAVSSNCKSDESDDSDLTGEDDESLHENADFMKSGLSTACPEKNCGKLGFSSIDVDDPLVLEMIIVKDVKAGFEVFNTYGSLGNAALLHRYGFTEPDNPFDIVNIDLELVLQWSSSMFSGRYSRSRLSLWRRLNFCGCDSQDSEYFEISSDGEPQTELLILLYVLLLSEAKYNTLDLRLSTVVKLDESLGLVLLKKGRPELGPTSKIKRDLLLTRGVREALLSLADIRESLYGSKTIEDDIEALKGTCCISRRSSFYSLMLRVSERKLLQKFRIYASGGGARGSRTTSRATKKRKLKH